MNYKFVVSRKSNSNFRALFTETNEYFKLFIRLIKSMLGGCEFDSRVLHLTRHLTDC